METCNKKFESLINQIKEVNEKNSKIKNKIKFQRGEINKTNTIINQHEECLKQQNEILNKLIDEKLAIKNYKIDLITELCQSESSDDEEYERSINGNQYKDDKFDSLVNFIKEANEKNSKIKNKVNFQIEEINKTKTIFNQYKECLKEQNEILNKLLNEKLVIKNFKNDLIKELSKSESSDEECDINTCDNQDKDDSFVQINSVNIDTRNDCDKKTHQNYLVNRKKISYNDQNIIDINESMNDNLKRFPNNIEDRCPTNLQSNCNDELIKINFESSTNNSNSYCNQFIENDNFISSPNSDNSLRKFLMHSGDFKIPENENSIFEDEDFIKNYSPKLMFKLNDDTVIDMNNMPKSLYVYCAKGVLLIYNKKTNLWSKFQTENSKNILQYTNFKNDHFLFYENEFVMFNELKTEVKKFNSKIISNLRSPFEKHLFCYISLENGEIWIYDLTKDKYRKITSLHSKAKACINLPYSSSLVLTEKGLVFMTHYGKINKIPELDGCLDFVAYHVPLVVCYFGNGVCKIYDMARKKIFELDIFESIKFAKHSKNILSVLDVQNRLHLYEFTRKTFNYTEIKVIQIPTSTNISAISCVTDKKVFINVENEIYLIKYN